MKQKIFQRLVDAYIALLKVEGSTLNEQTFQFTLVGLLGMISSEANQSSQETQDKYQEIALFEKENMNRYDCKSLQHFFENEVENEGVDLYVGNNLNVAWDRYKYKIYDTVNHNS